MIWAFGIAVVALQVIVMRLLLVHQRRAAQLRARQEPIRLRIREQSRGMQDSAARIQQTAALQTEGMRAAVDHLKEQSEALSRSIAALEAVGHPEGEAGRPTGTGLTGSASGLADGQEEARQKVRQLRRQHEEVDSHLGGVRRELQVVQRCLDRLAAKMQEQGPEPVKPESR